MAQGVDTYLEVSMTINFGKAEMAENGPIEPSSDPASDTSRRTHNGRHASQKSRSKLFVGIVAASGLLASTLTIVASCLQIASTEMGAPTAIVIKQPVSAPVQPSDHPKQMDTTSGIGQAMNQAARPLAPSARTDRHRRHHRRRRPVAECRSAAMISRIAPTTSDYGRRM
jgi:hypothetical protein